MEPVLPTAISLLPSTAKSSWAFQRGNFKEGIWNRELITQEVHRDEKLNATTMRAWRTQEKDGVTRIRGWGCPMVGTGKDPGGKGWLMGNWNHYGEMMLKTLQLWEWTKTEKNQTKICCLANYQTDIKSHSVVSDMDCSPPGSSIHRILQARILEWVAIFFSRGSSQPRGWTCISCIASGNF